MSSKGSPKAGFDCQAFCAAKLDFQNEVCVEDVVDAMGGPHQLRPSVCGASRARLLFTRRQRVPITLIHLESTRIVPQRPDEVETVRQFFQKCLDAFRPDVMLTYGGDPITTAMIAEARRREIPVVFALHNFAYTNPSFFANVDYCLVASQFAQRHYRDKVGLDCQALSYPMDWNRVRVEQPRAALCHVRQPMPRKRGVCLRPHRIRAGPPPAGYSAAGRREPGNQGTPGGVRS